MKLKWYLLFGLLGGLIIGPLISKIPGSTYILLDKTAIEFKNNVALGLLVLGLVLLWLVWLLIRYLLRTSNLTLNWFGDRNLRKARQNTIDGMIALAEGHWKTAEKLLAKGAQIRNTKLINYLAAARAAQEQGNDKGRDHYLHIAAKTQPDAQVAIGLTQAQLQMQHKQYEQALATLSHLRDISPHHPYVLKLLYQLYARLNDWQHVIDILPKLRKNRVFESSELNTIEILAWNHQLQKQAETANFDKLSEFWSSIPNHLRKSPELELTYGRALAQLQQDQELEVLVKDSVKHQWQDELIQLFGDIDTPQPDKTLAYAEGWLKQKPHNAVLLATLGKLALKAQLWGKAKSYLEQSLAIIPSAEAHYYLAQAYNQLGHPIQAQEAYQKGLANEVKPRREYDLIGDLTEKS
ncbi:heme biosynthesis protein HemY [Kangiella koreensis]|uniref:HemY domain protein n=1 Tax=Kangiella koreensis (strain DSM 16069 / JCM 12317 / KCTC 12182 / SW-125) TaxID=523791 RepID=C7R6S0_KANKD|nr:heme biosynthesis HemY N-terminal domain-containing protein [Kangiella koreensis]ACV25586.1 HemY domain protein [Kangiella koreensis DSM 16069]